MTLEDVINMGFFGKGNKTETIDNSRREFLKKAGIGAAALPFIYSGSNGVIGVAKYLMEQNPGMSEQEATGLAGRLMGEFKEGVSEGMKPNEAHAGDIPEAYRKSPGGYELWEVVNYAINGNKEEALKVLGLWIGRKNMPELGRILTDRNIHNINPLFWFIAIEYGLADTFVFHKIKDSSMLEFARGYYDYNNRDFTKAKEHFQTSLNTASNDHIALWASRFMALTIYKLQDKSAAKEYANKFHYPIVNRTYSIKETISDIFNRS